MALSAEHVTLLQAGKASSPAWNEAWTRVNAYLDALQVSEGGGRDALSLAAFERAVARQRREPFVAATQLAFEELQAVVGCAWGHSTDPDLHGGEGLVAERLQRYLGEADVAGSVRGTPASPSPTPTGRGASRLEAGPAFQLAVLTPEPLQFTRWGGRVASFLERAGSSRLNRLAVCAFGLAALAALIVASFSPW